MEDVAKVQQHEEIKEYAIILSLIACVAVSSAIRVLEFTAE